MRFVQMKLFLEEVAEDESDCYSLFSAVIPIRKKSRCGVDCFAYHRRLVSKAGLPFPGTIETKK